MISNEIHLDEPFFREWTLRKPGERRSLDRARRLMGLLDFGTHELPPLLTVVGSKGKGTTVAAATISLMSQGYRVGSIISPGFRSNRERIRVGGQALDPVEYERLSSQLADTLPLLREAEGGYLSPSGAFLIMGAHFLNGLGLDYVVFEEGMGGTSDEISFFSPDQVAVTPVFLEHADVLGDSIPSIVDDLLGVCGPRTRRIWTTPNQTPEARQSIDAAATRLGIPVAAAMIPNEIRASLDHVAGLSRVNAGLGATAAFALLDGAVDSAAAAQCLRRLRLPGRLSVHETELNGGTKWVVDAAINGVGAQAALNWTRETLGEPETVLLSVPLSKDREGCLQALASTHIVEVAGSSHLKFAAQPNGDPLPNLQEAIERNLVHGGIVLAIGTITFVADVLDEVDAATESWLMVS